MFSSSSQTVSMSNPATLLMASPSARDVDDHHEHIRALVRQGRSAKLGVPPDIMATYAYERQQIGSPPMSEQEKSAVADFYRQNRGYQFAWGQILEQVAGENFYLHFIPAQLIEEGASIRALNFHARDWYAVFEPVLSGYITLVEGPEFVPVSFRCDCDPSLVREWIADFFLATYWPVLIDTWAAHLRQTDEKGDLSARFTDAGPTDTGRMPVVLIYRPSYKANGELNVNAVQIILVSMDHEPRMCYASFNTQHGLSTSDWIPLPMSGRPFDVPAGDFIIDFHKDGGALAFQIEIEPDLQSIPVIIQRLLAQSRASVKEVDMRHALDGLSARPC